MMTAIGIEFVLLNIVLATRKFLSILRSLATLAMATATPKEMMAKVTYSTGIIHNSKIFSGFTEGAILVNRRQGVKKFMFKRASH